MENVVETARFWHQTLFSVATAEAYAVLIPEKMEHSFDYSFRVTDIWISNLLSMRNFFLLLLVCGLMFTWTGCSIEKRHYQKGYHVEWFTHKERPMGKEAQASIPSVEEGHTDSVVAPTEVCASMKDNPEMRQQLPKADPSEANKKIKSSPVSYLVKEKFVERSHRLLEGSIHVDSPPNNPEPVVNKSAQRSMNYGIATWALVLLLVLLNGVEVAPVVATLIFVGSLVCAILAILHGNWAKQELLVGPNPELNKRKASIGLVLGWVYVALLAFSVILVLLFLIFLLMLLG